MTKSKVENLRIGSRKIEYKKAIPKLMKNHKRERTRHRFMLSFLLPNRIPAKKSIATSRQIVYDRLNNSKKNSFRKFFDGGPNQLPVSPVFICAMKTGISGRNVSKESTTPNEYFNNSFRFTKNIPLKPTSPTNRKLK